jgi:hypothetical protein
MVEPTIGCPVDVESLMFKRGGVVNKGLVSTFGPAAENAVTGFPTFVVFSARTPKIR